MHYSSIPEKPLTARVNTDKKILRKEKVYFFEREDGTVFATNSNEAWTLYTKKQQNIGKYVPKLKLVGTGNGDIFLNALIEAQKETDIEKAQQIIRDGQEAEYQACKGNIIPPGNQDKFGDGANFI